MRFSTFIGCCLVALVMTTFSSCKKEYADYPYNDIEEFTILDQEGNTLKAALVNDSIWLYWPPLQVIPDSISPNIIISKNATISPASGEKTPFTSGLAYTVVSENGHTKAYYLKVASNQPSATVTTPPSFITLGSTIRIRGQYFSTDTNRIKVNLIDKEQRLIPTKLESKEALSSVYISALVPIDGSVLLDEEYEVQLISGSQRFNYGPFKASLSSTGLSNIGYSLDQENTTIQKGSIISFTYDASPIDKQYFSYEDYYVQLTILPAEASTTVTYQAPLARATDTKLTYQLGNDVPAGSITRLVIYGKRLSTGARASKFSQNYTAPYTTRIVD
ncbi:hypothetical protein [Olivibacter domesticus]|uniref:IPT/TIG domain-containing protein n=1 Tax=Olivibacter domesticus TaxID=407022 RepID=A0A1H7W3U7_OLID1|nr:hypothetical protein [Olivibacter domesticus]SEM16262.1 hypothetical protein SAMN05661044_04409 [Olivibacter domesticus]